MLKIVIFGATSAIAQSTAQWFAKDQSSFFLIARNSNRLKTVVEDLRVRGATQVDYSSADLSATDQHKDLLKKAQDSLKGLDVVLVAHGDLGDQKKAQQDYKEAERIFRLNFLSTISILTHVANDFEQKKAGSIAVISSVAGDRGRQSNYVYGSTKAALSTFLSGLRNRLAKSGVAVLTVKPGFVDTPMTQELKKNFLYAKPDAIGKGIYNAIQAKKDVVYLPKFWRWIMFIIKSIPERIFKKLSL